MPNRDGKLVLKKSLESGPKSGCDSSLVVLTAVLVQVPTSLMLV